MHQFDSTAARRHCELVGLDSYQARLRLLHWNQAAMNGAGAIDLPPGDPRRQQLPQLLADGYRAYLVAGGAKSDSEVTAVPALWAEWDGLDLDEVLGLLHELQINGLPEHTLMLTTWAHGSAHVWWRLAEPCTDLGRWRRVIRRLALALGSDTTCTNPSRLMRLAGSIYWAKAGHSQEGQALGAAEIRHEDPDATTTLDEVEEWLTGWFEAHPELADLERQGSEAKDTPPTEAERKAQHGGQLLPPRPLNTVYEALRAIPRRTSGLPEGSPWRYPRHRLIACGLRDALYRFYAANSAQDPDPDAAARAHAEAVQLMEAHSPSRECGWNVAQVLGSSQWLSEGNLWAAAREAGYQLPGTPKPKGEPPTPPTPPAGAPPALPPPPPDAYDTPFKAIGETTDGTSFYTTLRNGRVHQISPANHRPAMLLKLASYDWWAITCPNRQQTAPDWILAANLCARLSERAGWFDPDTVRGIGAWRDGNSLLLNLGDRLILNGAVHPLPANDLPLRHVYPQAPARVGPGDGGNPLTTEEGLGVLQLAGAFRWATPAHGLLLCGWVAIAPFAGALERWRSHAWITAPRGSGKSVLLQRFVQPLLGDMACCYNGSVTEAGLRQAAHPNALPIVIDEADAQTQKGRDNRESILELARAASTGGNGAAKVTGSPSGGARTWRVRSMFLLCSIVSALNADADRSRWAVLELLSPSTISAEQRLEHWDQLDGRLREVMAEGIGQRLQARMLQLLPQLAATIEALSRAAATVLGEARHGDQYGLLLAGAWLLQADTAPTAEQAAAWVGGLDWSRTADQLDSSDSPDENCWQAIQSMRLQVPFQERTQERTVSELLIAVAQQGGHQVAEEALGRLGIRRVYSRAAGRHLIAVARTNYALQQRLKDTPWAGSGWHGQLQRLQPIDVVNNLERVRQRFPALDSSRPLPCFMLPDVSLEGSEQLEAPPF